MLSRKTPLKARKPWRPKRKKLERKTPLRSHSRLQSKTPLQSKTRPRSHKPMKKKGARMTAWDRVWQWLKPRLQKAGRTFCEFDFLPHECSGPLDPVHSKKRGQMTGIDIYRVGIGCRNVHNYLDGVYVYPPFGRRISHEEMHEFVMQAVNNHGGVIVPENIAE